MLSAAAEPDTYSQENCQHGRISGMRRQDFVLDRGGLTSFHAPRYSCSETEVIAIVLLWRKSGIVVEIKSQEQRLEERALTSLQIWSSEVGDYSITTRKAPFRQKAPDIYGFFDLIGSKRRKL